MVGGVARGFTRIGLVAVAVFATTAAAPGSAAAVDRFVDDGGVDSNPACPQANPCKTIVYALANSGTGDEIILDNGTYPESVTLGDGRSLSFSNFAPGDAIGPAIVDGGAGTAITVTGTGAGHIRDLTIRGDAGGVLMDGPVEVDGNSFDDPDAAAGSPFRRTAAPRAPRSMTTRSRSGPERVTITFGGLRASVGGRDPRQQLHRAQWRDPGHGRVLGSRPDRGQRDRRASTTSRARAARSWRVGSGR